MRLSASQKIKFKIQYILSMKAKGFYFIEYPKHYNNELEVAGKLIYKDTSIKPEWAIIQYGNVVSSLNPEVKEGDRIYFNYIVAHGDEELLHVDGKQYLRVPEEMAYCKVVDGVITPLGGHVLCKAVYDDGVEEIKVDGKNIQAKLKGNLVVQLDFKHDERITTIAHIGENDLGVKPGDTVVMDSHCDNKNEIEGVEYFVMHQENILCLMTY